MAELHFETVIQRPIADVFGLIADLPHYKAWLSPSSLYGAVAQVSEQQTKLGTRYVDQGKTTRMTGAVTQFEPPHRITFRQSTVSLLGSLEVEVRYTLETVDAGTRVARDVIVKMSGGMQLLEGITLGAIRKESERILASMKAWLEKDI